MVEVHRAFSKVAADDKTEKANILALIRIVEHPDARTRRWDRCNLSVNDCLSKKEKEFFEKLCV